MNVEQFEVTADGLRVTCQSDLVYVLRPPFKIMDIEHGRHPRTMCFLLISLFTAAALIGFGAGFRSVPVLVVGGVLLGIIFIVRDGPCRTKQIVQFELWYEYGRRTDFTTRFFFKGEHLDAVRLAIKQVPDNYQASYAIRETVIPMQMPETDETTDI